MGGKGDFLILQYVFRYQGSEYPFQTTRPYYPNGLSERYFNSKFLKFNYQKNKEKIKTEILSKTESLKKSGYINQLTTRQIWTNKFEEKRSVHKST